MDVIFQLLLGWFVIRLGNLDGELRDEHISGEIGEVVAGVKPGRESQQERILFWHKGFAVSDIVLGNLAYQKAVEKGVGTLLSYYREPRDM
jgi:ornithine cyclodeaminase